MFICAYTHCKLLSALKIKEKLFVCYGIDDFGGHHNTK